MLLSKITWQAYKFLLARPLGELDRFRNLNPSAQREELGRRLLAQIRYFGSREDALPEWREASRITNPKDLWKIWPSLPAVTKPILNTQFEPREMQRRFRLKGRINSTGGSTGEPTRFFLDLGALRASRGVHYYSRLKMGWRAGMSTIIVWGSERDIGKQSRVLPRVASHLYGNHLIPGFEVDDNSVARILSVLDSKKPVAIYGYSSLLQHVAERVIAKGWQVPPGSIAVAWNGGEMLLDNQIDLFRRAFGVPILNRYGGRELSVTAFQSKEDSSLQLVRPWVFAEIVTEDGKPASPGQTGRLLLTSTVCRGTPFIRYEIGDLATYSDQDFDESGVTGLSSIDGRSAGSIHLSDGKVISSVYWNHLFKEYPEIVQFQVRVAPDRRSLNILLRGQGFGSGRESQLRDTLRLLWRDQAIHFVWTESIPRSSQGKLVQVVQEC